MIDLSAGTIQGRSGSVSFGELLAPLISTSPQSLGGQGWEGEVSCPVFTLTLHAD